MNAELALLQGLPDTPPMRLPTSIRPACAGLSLSLLLAGCSGGCLSGSKDDAGTVDAGPRELAEKEPNDRPEQALPLTDSSLVTAMLGSDPSAVDEDWFLLAPPAPVQGDLTVSGVPGGDVVLEVLDADRNRLAVVNSEGEGKPERLPNLKVQGKIWVKVTSAKKGAGGAYTFTALFREPELGFEFEPNDRAVDAYPLPLGEKISGFVGHAGDEDWYRIELVPGGAAALPPPVVPDAAAAVPVPVEDGGAVAVADAGAANEGPKIALKIDLTPIEGVKLELAVLSAAEAPLFSTKSKDGEGLSLRNVGVRATDQVIYVVVKSAWMGTGKEAKRGYNAQAPYSLSVAPEEAGANAEYEPNDELLKATPLPPGGFREGFLSPKGDVDYYVIKADQPVLAQVQLAGVERLDLELQVVQPPAEGAGPGPETVLMKVNDGVVKEPELLNNLRCAPLCFLKVMGAQRKGPDGKWVRDFENAEMPYKISANVVPDDGSQEHEPNASFDTATSLSIGKPVRGTVHPKKDVDYYKLDLSERPVKVALRASSTGILKVDVGLYLHAVDEEGKLSLVQTADRAKGDQPETIRYTAEPGVYLLEVRDSKSRESNFQDAYQLVVELEE
jgi:hypothetical protein